MGPPRVFILRPPCRRKGRTCRFSPRVFFHACSVRFIYRFLCPLALRIRTRPAQMRERRSILPPAGRRQKYRRIWVWLLRPPLSPSPHPRPRPPRCSSRRHPTMYYGGPQRPLSTYWPSRASPPLSPMYSPGSYSGSYYDSPEMRMVPIYPQYAAQPMAQPPMLYRPNPVYYHRLMRRPGQPMCCRDLCGCETCCDECCGPQSCCGCC
ncbi:hypothetical protein BC628DRAFT_1151374 [Trametes gibbosa]|nr:hypothetical protein BC628DRAFT_1151374 [Trametes gibbosa]